MANYYTTESASFRNTIYSLNTALIDYYTTRYFKNDTKRIVYASTEYAFRQRAKGTENNTLDFPFMNFKVTAITPDTARPWHNYKMLTDGFYVEEINRKLRYAPIHIDYDATMFFESEFDAQFAYQKLMYESEDETQIPFYITIENTDMKMIAIVNYDLAYEPTYDRTDWLEKNKIHSIQVNVNIDTFYILDNTDISVPKEVLLQFNALNSDGEEMTSLEEIYDLMDTYFTDPQ